MELSETQTTLFAQTRDRLEGFFAVIAQGCNGFVDIMARGNLVESLYRKTDAELAELGLKREDIARYVFKDMLNASQ